MATRAKKFPFLTMGDLLKQLGGIPANRVRLQPLPGQATERDLIRVQVKTNRNCELVDGVLVEKPMGLLESSLAMDLGLHLGNFLSHQDLGFLTGESGPTRLIQGIVRVPDLSFFSWQQLPTHERITEPVAGLAPDLAAEILSEGNTKGEMRRKLREYFLAGVRLVWYIDPRQRTVTVFTSPEDALVLNEDDTLDGGDVLPGFSLPLRTLFAGVPKTFRMRPKKAGGRPSGRKRRKGGAG